MHLCTSKLGSFFASKHVSHGLAFEPSSPVVTITMHTVFVEVPHNISCLVMLSCYMQCHVVSSLIQVPQV